jgi:hypothetical protein
MSWPMCLKLPFLLSLGFNGLRRLVFGFAKFIFKEALNIK